MDDRRLVEEVRLGSVDCFRTLVERHAAAVFRIARATVRRSADAEDLAQEIFVAAYEGLPRLRDPSRFRPYLLSIAARRAADHLRRRRPEPAALAEEPPAREADPRDGRLDSLESAVEALDGPTRLLFALRHHEGLSCVRIARLLGEPVGTVYSRLSRAHARLRAAMGVRDA